MTSNRRELGRTDKGQVKETQNNTSRFPTVLLASLMMYFYLFISFNIILNVVTMLLWLVTVSGDFWIR